MQIIKGKHLPNLPVCDLPNPLLPENAHVESAVSKVNSLWAVDENAVVERLHPVSVTTLQL